MMAPRRGMRRDLADTSADQAWRRDKACLCLRAEIAHLRLCPHCYLASDMQIEQGLYPIFVAFSKVKPFCQLSLTVRLLLVARHRP